MNECNILILSAGRRVELIRCFQAASQRIGVLSKVIAGDCSLSAPALYVADGKVILPRISDVNYIDAIIQACQKYDIRLVVPTIDTELLVLAEHKARIEQETAAKVVISDTDVVAICRDKEKTSAFLEKHGFLVPKLYRKEELQKEMLRFPLFIKPRSGSSSIHAYRVNSFEELKMYQQLIADPIVQDFMEGPEYTVDVFTDFDGNVITVVPRLRMATRSGEIMKGKIIKDPDIILDIKRLIAVLKPIGHITIQLMKTGRGIEYIEINPRFGGGAPMSIKSGADSCEHLYRLMRGETLDYHENYRDNLMFFRFDDCICVNENYEIVTPFACQDKYVNA